MAILIRCRNKAGNLVCENKHKLSPISLHLTFSLETTYEGKTVSVWSVVKYRQIQYLWCFLPFATALIKT